MTADEARDRVVEIRTDLRRVMRALSVSGPRWGDAVAALLDVSAAAEDLSLLCLRERIRGEAHGNR